MFVKNISLNVLPGKYEYMVSWEEVSDHGEHGRTKLFKSLSSAKKFVKELERQEADSD